MQDKNLLIAQRVIAGARLGSMPTTATAKQTLAAIAAAQHRTLRLGEGALALEPARAAASLLVLSHMPNVAMCIEAVKCLGSVLMAEPEQTEASEA